MNSSHEQTQRVIAQGVIRILVDNDVISEPVGNDLLAMFHDRSAEFFADFILEDDSISKHDLLEALSDYYDVPWFDADGYFFETHVLREFPKGFLLRENCIPLERDENMLIVVASHPSDELEVALNDFVSYEIKFHVGLKRDINDAVKEYYDKAITEGPQDEDSRVERQLAHEEKEIEEYGDDPSKKREKSDVYE